MNTNKTLQYYNLHAEKFASDTMTVNFSANQEKFLAKLPGKKEQAKLLDFGCGAGRDTKYFLERGYDVEAIDGSSELCRIASAHTGICVRQMLFEQWSEQNRYDGIWACASILHIPSKQLPQLLQKMERALKKDGILYTSFKYGIFEGEKNGRYFTYMTEQKMDEVFGHVFHLLLEERWITSDVRKDRGEEKWLNVLLRKR